MRRTILVILCALVPAAAFAQPAYVGVSLIGDISRFTTIEVEPSFFSTEFSEGGETLGFGLVAGTALGDRWGVELEFVRPGLLERSTTQRLPTVPPGLPVPLPIPIVEYEFRSEQRHTTLTTAVWFRQPIGGRAELCYLGGIAFARIAQRQDVSIDPRRLVLPIPIVQDVTEHTVGPMVGLEGRVRLTRQLALTPGIRLLAVSASGREGWLIRPGVGLHWRF